MDDSPCQRFLWSYPNSNIKSVARKLKFNLMLAAIEENSGKIIKLAEVKWTHDIKLMIDTTKPPNSRVIPVKYQTLCYYKGGKLIY